MPDQAANDDVSLSPIADRAVGARLAALRKARGLTLSRLAKLSGLEPRLLKLQEAGVVPLASVHLINLAGVFNVELSVFFREGEPTPPAIQEDAQDSS